jgi:hypothetical protein
MQTCSYYPQGELCEALTDVLGCCQLGRSAQFCKGAQGFPTWHCLLVTLYAQAAQSEDIAPSKAVAEQNGAAVRKSKVDLPAPTSRDELGSNVQFSGWCIYILISSGFCPLSTENICKAIVSWMYKNNESWGLSVQAFSCIECASLFFPL